jgi:hypothetical protein
MEETVKEFIGRETESSLEKEVNTTISFVLGVGRSSPFVSYHYSMARLGRRWLSTSLKSSSSSTEDGLNISG